MIRWLLNALGIDHSPSLAFTGDCACQRCLELNPHRLNFADGLARAGLGEQCGRPILHVRGNTLCGRAPRHNGICLPALK